MRRFLFSFLTFIFLWQQPVAAYKHELSFCMIFQNDAPYLKEWIEFHRLMGGEHFYLYNNLSTDNYLQVLAPYVQKGIVELFDWPFPSNNVNEWDAIQVMAYQDACNRAKRTSKWLAILDSDEFLFPVKDDNLIKFLSRYEKNGNIGGVCVNWVMYGTSNVPKISSNQLMIETLLLSKGAGDSHYKSIVRPDKVLMVVSPHYCKYKDGVYHCKPSKTRDSSAIEIDRVRINHYWSRDEWYLNNVKIPRRELWGTPKEASLLWAQLGNAFFDTSAFRFIAPMRERVFGNHDLFKE